METKSKKKVKKYIWRKNSMYEYRIPIEKNLVATEMNSNDVVKPIDLKCHHYKPTGRTSPKLGYEYEYCGTDEE